MVNILLAGYDKEIGPSLYFIDYIATLHKIDKGAFGYGSYFSLAMMDRHYHSGMSVEEAVDLVDKCIIEIRSRLVIAPPNFVIKIVDKDGAREYAWRESIKDAGAPAVPEASAESEDADDTSPDKLSKTCVVVITKPQHQLSCKRKFEQSVRIVVVVLLKNMGEEGTRKSRIPGRNLEFLLLTGIDVGELTADSSAKIIG
ncbi:hypothetical protein HHK36_020590 [Tetracentron sinense]|uniref:Uncharacterized protein n=1 Tax=Tetracentron sinense TaxID=13715 RepID=A0A835DB67_TETSI|nr:hypothetical protein HHK36_020590 [Tetracentron sinense]